MTKEEKTLFDINNKIADVLKDKQTDIQLLEKELYEPLIQKAKDVKNKISLDMNKKYESDLLRLNSEQKTAKEIVDNISIEKAKDLWYAPETPVFLWERLRSWSRDVNWKKEKTKGIVKVYDGTQILASVPSYRLPKKGDIIVIRLKNNGEIGLKFDIISSCGTINSYHPMWLSETDTPTDNIETRAEKNQ